MTTARVIDEAKRLAGLGLFGDSWEVLERLSPAEWSGPAVRVVRLEICKKLGCWELGQDVARGISHWDTLCHREAAGEFHLAHAIELCRSGDVAGARAAVRALTMVWPDGREVAFDSEALALLWGSAMSSPS